MTIKRNVIHACWLDKDKDSVSWCEFCSNTNSNKTYLPFTKNTLNPEHICEDCVKGEEFELVDFIEHQDEYRNRIIKLKP